jgi:hypothetical protein
LNNGFLFKNVSKTGLTAAQREKFKKNPAGLYTEILIISKTAISKKSVSQWAV